eukprot:4101415-Amphidinium_carterae.1
MGFEDPQSRDLAKHVGLHPGILLGCFNHSNFTALVQWLVARIADAGIVARIGASLSPRCLARLCQRGGLSTSAAAGGPPVAMAVAANNVAGLRRKFTARSWLVRPPPCDRPLTGSCGNTTFIVSYTLRNEDKWWTRPTSFNAPGQRQPLAKRVCQGPRAQCRSGICCQASVPCPVAQSGGDTSDDSATTAETSPSQASCAGCHPGASLPSGEDNDDEGD